MYKITPEKFFNACITGDSDIVMEFLNENQYPIDIRNEKNWTGLIMACFNEREKVAKLLIENGADINATNHKGTTVFMYAKTPVQQNPTKVFLLNYLLENGANINAKDEKGLTVLDYVKKNGYKVLANWLKSKGAKSSKTMLNNV